MKRRIENSPYEFLEMMPGVYDCFLGARWIATVGAASEGYLAFCRAYRNEASEADLETVKRVLARETVRLVFSLSDLKRL